MKQKVQSISEIKGWIIALHPMYFFAPAAYTTRKENKLLIENLWLKSQLRLENVSYVVSEYGSLKSC